MRNRKKPLPQNSRSDDFHGLVRFVNLAEKTIEDPFREKRLLELGYEAFLQHFCLNQRVHAQDLKSRIIEVYRQCYERSPNNPESVITDFVAAYPQLSFESEWLRLLVKTQAGNRDFRPNGPRNRLFRAMTTGFRRLANPGPRINRSMRDAQMEAARFALRDIRKDLDEWEGALERSTATPEWIDQRANEKAKELFPHPTLERHQKQLKELLRQRKHYQASIFVAAKIYRVRTRDLESRQS